MGRKWSCVIICLVMIVALTTCGKQEAPKKEETSKKTENYDTKPFDTKVTALPPGYLGHDIVALYERLAKAFPPKDEFESTDVYRKRLETVLGSSQTYSQPHNLIKHAK
jgi:hypothetical protein